VPVVQVVTEVAVISENLFLKLGNVTQG